MAVVWGTQGFVGTLCSGERSALEREGVIRDYQPGAALFREGEPSQAVFVVTHGRVRVWQSGVDGSQLTLAVLDAGDLLGELSAIDNQARSATATALGQVQAMAVPAERFLAFLQDQPRVSLDLLRLIAGRLRSADIRHGEVITYDVKARLARRLLELADPADGHVVAGVSQEELASWVGTSRESISLALTAMSRAGWIITSRLKIEIRDLDALRRFAR